MKNFGAKWLALAAVVAAAAGLSLNGCGDGGGGTGAAGTTGSGGRGGTTGAAGRGGTTGTAGTTAMAGRGGTTGVGGSTAGTSGGGTGGGTAGTAGPDGGMGGGLGCPGLATFDTNDLQSFGLNTFMDTAANAAINLAVREAGTRATIAWNGTEGDPAPGSLKVDAPFDDYNQFVDIQRGYGASMLKDWRGYKLHVRMKVMGGNPSAMNPMGVQPYINTGTTYAYCAKYTNLASGGGWNDYVTDLSMCGASVDPSMVIAFGVSLQAGNGSNGDGGVNPTKPVAATIYVDSFWLEGSCGGTGGTGGGAGGTGGGAAGTGGGTAGTTATAGTGGGTAGTTAAAGTGGGTAGTTAAAGTGGGAAGRGGTGGGTAGTTATAGTGGGAAGTGGAATSTLYDFEAGVQTWSTSTPTTVTASTDQHLDGAQSLKITYGALDGSNILATVNGPALWPGTALTFHLYLPAGFDTSGAAYFQAFTQSNNYKVFDTNGNGTRTATAGAWNTWTYTVPNTFPGGLQQLGFQLGDNAGGSTIPAGSVYLDAITATGGTQNCAVATGTGTHTFEAALDPNVYQKDGTDADTVASQTTERPNLGTGSWKVAFTALPAPPSGMTTSRRVYIAGPNIYCGQIATVHVYLPPGSDGLTFQVFSQYNNYANFGSAGPTTVTRDAWNTYAYTIPSTVGPGGIQRLGVQLIWSGTAAFTGNVYIDDVTW